MYDRQFVGAEWTHAHSSLLDVINPTTEAVIARTPAGDAADVDAAVAAARAALPAWSATPARQRGQYLRDLAAVLERRRDDLAELIAREVGTPLRLARGVQVGFPLRSLATAADLAESYDFERPLDENSVLVREPYGVVGAITPWNFPLHQIVAKVAYAWVAGNTVVLKPSEVAPLTAWELAKATLEVGLPAGVFNVVGGSGPVVGEALAAHPGVDAVSFTGSEMAGTRAAELAATTVKSVSLELGGKGADVMLPDADPETVVPAAVTGVTFNSGQACGALTRLLVPEQELDRVERLAAAAATAVVIGDPLTKGTRMGPVVSRVQRDRVRAHIDHAKHQGAHLVVGGSEAPGGIDAGWFVRPTVFSRVTSDMDLHHEEVFGPVLAIESFTDEDDAVAIANDTRSGLTGGVWTDDPEAASRVCRGLQAGQVWVNGKGLDPTAPFGGYKRSGVGREYGLAGLEEFLETKVIR